jgi:hypothetical protein
MPATVYAHSTAAAAAAAAKAAKAAKGAVSATPAVPMPLSTPAVDNTSFNKILSDQEDFQ